jgi:hypothetical protein
MANLRRGLVDKVKKVAAKAGTRGARALVETTAAAVKTVDKLQEKLGRHASKASSHEESLADTQASSNEVQKTPMKASSAKAQKASAEPKSRRASAETPPMMARETGRKTMPAAAPKRSKAAAAAPGFKVKRGQKHRHTGR